MTDRSAVQSSIGVGMPFWLKLNLFGRTLRDAFPGVVPYLVGTAARSKSWRDVDVRMILDEGQWIRLVGPGEIECRGPHYGSRAGALALAFSELGCQMTGLPIDFQLMTASHAEQWYNEEPRVPLGIQIAAAERTVTAGDRQGATDGSPAATAIHLVFAGDYSELARELTPHIRRELDKPGRRLA